MARKYIKLKTLGANRIDPDNTTVECEAEGCKNEVLIAASYSFVVVFATTGPQPIASFGCEEEQHFACSPKHARDAALACMNQHLMPKHQEKVDEVLGGKTTVTETDQRLLP